MVAVLFIVFVVALAIGVPVAFSLGLASVAYMLGSHIQMINFAQYFFKGLDSFTLLHPRLHLCRQPDESGRHF